MWVSLGLYHAVIGFGNKELFISIIRVKFRAITYSYSLLGRVSFKIVSVTIRIFPSTVVFVTYNNYNGSKVKENNYKN